MRLASKGAKRMRVGEGPAAAWERKKDRAKEGSGDVDADADADADVDLDAPGGDVQRAVVRLLGRLGGRSQALLAVPTDDAAAPAGWAADTDLLRLTLPLPPPPPAPAAQVVGLPLALGRALPRVLELCAAGGDDDAAADGPTAARGAAAGAAGRQVRTAAAEALHAALTVLLGRAQNALMHAARGDTSVYAAAYERLMPAALALACSRDPVPLALFSTLLPQLAKWLSQDSKKVVYRGPHPASS